MPTFASHEELEAHLQREVPAATATLALESATSLVQSWCGWVIARETATFVVNGTGSHLVALPTLLLEDVTAVRIGGEEQEYSALAGYGYTWSLSGHLYRAAGWPAGFRNIEAECVHGYDPIPDIVRHVTLGLAARAVVNPEGLRSAAVGTVSRAFDLSKLDLSLLGPFRLPQAP